MEPRKLVSPPEEPERETLREKAISIDRARRPNRKKSENTPLEVWKGLAAGRWTILDHFDREGRHYVIVRRNDPRVGRSTRLSPRQRAVVAHVALGHSNKHIAYELGLSASTVSMQIAAAMSRLGVSSRVELVRVLGRVIAASMRASKHDE